MFLFSLFSFLSDIQFFLFKWISIKPKFSIKYFPTFSILTNHNNNTKQIIYYTNSQPTSFFNVICFDKTLKFDKEYQIPGNKLDSEFWKYYFNVPHFDKILLLDTKLKTHELLFGQSLIFLDDKSWIIS